MRIRQSVATLTLGNPEAAQRQPWHPILEIYARGVHLMRELDAQLSPDSWMWAANTHGIDMQTIPRPAWGQCTHRARHFLPWHRAYLAWFEETIRRLTSEPDWALPYWNYSNADSDRIVPVEFRVPERTDGQNSFANPLFAQGRSPSPIPEEWVDVVPALAEPRYIRLAPEVGFGGLDRNGLAGFAEQLPHNYVHGAIGGLMGSTTTAGRDPIFWLHHANIDRLWEIWRSMPDSQPITAGAASPLVVSEWNSARFWFGDENAPRTYTMASVEDLSSADMGYAYDDLTLEEPVAKAVAEARERVAAEAPGGLALDDITSSWRPVAAAFDLDSGDALELRFDQRQMALDDSTPTGLVVELAGARSTRPHAAYVVEVRSAPGGPAHIAGGFSTFGLEGTPATDEANYLVDASQIVPELLDEGWSGGELVVRVVPDPALADANDEDLAIHVRQVTVYTRSV